MADSRLFSYEGLRVSSSVRRVIERHPQLDEVTERRLLLAAQSGDIKARQKLINHNLAFVCKVGGVYRQKQSHRLLLDDEVLFNQGIIGLTDAIEGWSPEGGARLQTFAYWHVRKAMQSDDSLYSDNTIRVPQSVRDQLKQIHQVIQQHEGPLTTEEIAEQTQLKVKRVETLLQIHQPSSLNVIEQGYQTELVDRIADPDTEVVSDMQEILSTIPLEISTAIQEQRWGDLLTLIPSTLAEVIRLHFLEGETFKVISKQLSIPIHKVGAVVREGIEALRIQFLSCEANSTPVEPESEPIEESKPLASIITRGLGFGAQVARKAKRAVKKVAEVLSHPLQVFTRSTVTEPTTDNATQPNSSADSTSVSTSVTSFGAAHNNIVDFERSSSRGVVSLSFYTQKEFDSGGLVMIRDFFIFFLGLLFSSALHVSGVVDASRWGRIVDGEEVSDIADDVGDVVKEKLKK